MNLHQRVAVIVYPGESLASGAEGLAGLRRRRVPVCNLDGVQFSDHAAMPQVGLVEQAAKVGLTHLADVAAGEVVKGCHA